MNHSSLATSTQRIVLTGASRGLGVHLAVDLARGGHELVLVARDAAGLAQTAEQVRAVGGRPVILPADLATGAGRAALLGQLDALGDLDAVVHNAGLEIPLALMDQTPADIEAQVQLNLLTPLLMTSAMLPRMVRRGSGAIVFVGSMSGKAATPWNAVYAATKHGLVGLVASVQHELEGTGVRVGVVCPSFIADAGMWHDTGLKAPFAMREVPLSRVCAGVRRAITHGGEVLVTPGPIRPLLALQQLWPGMDRPVLRWMGVTEILRQRARVTAARRGPRP